MDSAQDAPTLPAPTTVIFIGEWIGLLLD